MSIKKVIEDIEQECLRDRYRDDILNYTQDVQEYFDSFEDAVDFVKAYDREYNMESPNFDPEDYAESWYSSFDSMDGIVDSLDS